MDSKSSKFKSGFTLMELMVVVAIIGIMTAVTIVSLNRGKTEKQLEVAAREVAGAIREAQSNALNGKVLDPTKIPCKFFFARNTTFLQNQYKINYYWNNGIDENGDGNKCNDNEDIKTVYLASLKNGVNFVNEGCWVFFSLPFGEMEVSSSCYGGNRIRLTKDGSFYYVYVCPGGQIKECKDECGC